MSLPHIILTRLLEKDATGYEITKSFEGDVGLYWKASHQQVYRELNKLEELKLVKHKLRPQLGKPDRKVYRILANGEQAIQEWLLEPSPKKKLRDEVQAKLMAHLAYPTFEFKDELDELLQSCVVENTELQNLLESEYANKEELSNEKRGVRLSIIRKLEMNKAFVTWATEVVEELEAMKL